MMRSVLLAVLLTFCTSVLPAAAEDSDCEVSESQVRAAIDMMMNHPLKPETAPAPAIVDAFAEESEEVDVVIDSKFCPPAKCDKKWATLLMAYYVAGSVKDQLDHPKQKDGKVLSCIAGIRSELFIYKLLRANHPEVGSAAYNNLLKLDEQNKLVDYVRNVLAKH